MSLFDERFQQNPNELNQAIPPERRAVASIQAALSAMGGQEKLLEWAQHNEVWVPGDIVMAEVSPTYRCPESCEGCPDGYWLLLLAIQKGLKPKNELRAQLPTMLDNIRQLYTWGVRHFMFIGGTIDHLPETPAMIETAQGLEGTTTSWFSDGIVQVNEDGTRSREYEKNLGQPWFMNSATHVSLDYPYIGTVSDHQTLPPKKGRANEYKKHPDYSRFFKSQYGYRFAQLLIENHVRRVVLNMTISPRNVADILTIFKQVTQLQRYGQSIQSPTEVMFTFSPWIWRPHQARGDNPEDNPQSGGLQMSDMPKVNEAFSAILDQEYQRIARNEPRLLANSSGYTELMANPRFRHIVVNQAVAYPGGKPEMFQIHPDGFIKFDPMFDGPELVAVASIFGYRDREPRKERNVFTSFHQNENNPWFANIITT